MGTTPMCKNTTDDGRLFISLAEIQSRCAADSHCAGFAEDTKDGPAYFRPRANAFAKPSSRLHSASLSVTSLPSSLLAPPSFLLPPPCVSSVLPVDFM